MSSVDVDESCIIIRSKWLKCYVCEGLCGEYFAGEWMVNLIDFVKIGWCSEECSKIKGLRGF